MMRGLNYLPIWRDANRLLLEIEEAVRGFARYHKYTIGSDLRSSCLRLCRTIPLASKSTEPGPDGVAGGRPVRPVSLYIKEAWPCEEENNNFNSLLNKQQGELPWI